MAQKEEKKNKKILFILVGGAAIVGAVALLSRGAKAQTPVLGCTNPQATNYNPNATQDDGSCQLPQMYQVAFTCGMASGNMILKPSGKKIVINQFPNTTVEKFAVGVYRFTVGSSLTGDNGMFVVAPKNSNEVCPFSPIVGTGSFDFVFGAPTTKTYALEFFDQNRQPVKTLQVTFPGSLSINVQANSILKGYFSVPALGVNMEPFDITSSNYTFTVNDI